MEKPKICVTSKRNLKRKKNIKKVFVLVSVLQRNRTKRLYIMRFIIRNWLTCYGAEKSHHLTSACWRPRKGGHVNSSPSSKAWEQGTPAVWIPAQGQEKTNVSAQQSGRERIQTFFFCFVLFCSIQVLNGLNDDHPQGRGQSGLLSPPIQMLISSTNTLTDTPRNNV